ncbi:MAG: hypothetical protein F2554_00810 [Actinobacteria bacterium]|uniref:Unannotated protein n=1 Tax=freshwater metagenome TaxID=449393 RepID=A0A6J6D9W8_9ZZZZ|nr:hypothetical protein [Actinomycetota bacterium]
MMESYILFPLLALLFLFIWYLTFTASRLDRLHHRVETSWAALDALLQQRAALALEVSHLPGVDPAVAMVLTQSAFLAGEAEIAERSEAEDGLAATVELLYETEDFHQKNPALSERITNVSKRIEVAMRLHREAVHTTGVQRSRPLVRLFRLAGRAPLPVVHPFEISGERTL